MIQLDESDFTPSVMKRLSEAAVGERVVIEQNGEPIAVLERVVSAPRSGDLDLDELREIRRHLGIEPATPEKNAAWEKDFSAPAFSREAFGVGDD